MFLENSRYASVAQTTIKTRSGREVNVVKLRRLPATTGSAYVVQGNDRLDIIAQRHYADSTRFWHVADANSELRAPTLTEKAGRTVIVPGQA
jgi:hypothetical protein